jgi:hypothetical protein
LAISAEVKLPVGAISVLLAVDNVASMAEQ